MMRPIGWASGRLVDWWARTHWGWLVLIGPMICYLALLTGLDIVGLASDRQLYYSPIEMERMFRTGIELDLYSIGGRVQFALTASLYTLVSAFSIIWAATHIADKSRNPFGGLTGLGIATGASLVLYASFLASEYNLRIALADDLLKLAEDRGGLRPIEMRFALFGVTFVDAPMRTSDMLETVHAVVYFFGNAAPWFLIVFAACCAAFEPRSFGREKHKILRERMANLQISVVLAAANIVLSVAYLRSMSTWPERLLVDDLSADFVMASTRYTAIWGATGTLMLIAALAPAYVSLNSHFDRIAEHELMREGDDYVSYDERMDWRRKHGLLLSAQAAVTTGAAVFAPLLAAPTLDAGSNDEHRPRYGYEQTLGADGR